MRRVIYDRRLPKYTYEKSKTYLQSVLASLVIILFLKLVFGWLVHSKSFAEGNIVKDRNQFKPICWKYEDSQHIDRLVFAVL